MDTKSIIALAKEHPRTKCLRCSLLIIAPNKAPVDGKSAVCRRGLEPESCGRNFNPKDGGDKVLV